MINVINSDGVLFATLLISILVMSITLVWVVLQTGREHTKKHH